MPNSAEKITRIETESETPVETSQELAVFPLPLFILPRGRQRLRIFEPKYLKMVAHAAQGDGFIIATQDNTNSERLSSWGQKCLLSISICPMIKSWKSMLKENSWFSFTRPSATQMI